MPIKLLYTFLFYFVILTAQGNVLAVYEHKHAEGESGTFTLAEQHLYGASRIGMTKPNLALNTTMPDAPVPTIHYELTNHLGNVMAVITDEPAATETPAVESLTDYYPFGMTMPGRSYNAHTYRHGFTGHEKESDLAEGIYTTEYRLYDARVGRWLSVDPLFEKYVGMSPYNYCMLNPVMMVDPDGRVPIETIWDIGNILYDIGAAICNHIKGKHQAAKENWRDLGLDASATLIPYVPAGASKVVKVGKVLEKTTDVVSKFGQLEKASEYGFKSYKELKKVVEKNSGLQVHHLIEQRFAEKLGVKTDDMLSIILTKEEHQAFTKAWRKAIDYKNTKARLRTDNATTEQIYDVAKEIYKDYPEILKALKLE